MDKTRESIIDKSKSENNDKIVETVNIHLEEVIEVEEKQKTQREIDEKQRVRKQLIDNAFIESFIWE